jgi:hypothetical protein
VKRGLLWVTNLKSLQVAQGGSPQNHCPLPVVCNPNISPVGRERFIFLQLATHLRGAHAAARQRDRPWSAVLTRLDLGCDFAFVHWKLSRDSQRPFLCLSFWHCFRCPGANFSPAARSQNDSGQTTLPSSMRAPLDCVLATSLSSCFPPAVPLAAQSPSPSWAPVGLRLPFRGCSSHVSTALAWQAVAMLTSLAVGRLGGD